MKYNKMNPFDWGVQTRPQYKTTQNLRNAKWTNPNKGKFEGNTKWAFFSNEMPPTPQVANVCGIDCPKC